MVFHWRKRILRFVILLIGINLRDFKKDGRGSGKIEKVKIPY